jgi:hypothetical protein
MKLNLDAATVEVLNRIQLPHIPRMWLKDSHLEISPFHSGLEYAEQEPYLIGSSDIMGWGGCDEIFFVPKTRLLHSVRLLIPYKPFSWARVNANPKTEAIGSLGLLEAKPFFLAWTDAHSLSDDGKTLMGIREDKLQDMPMLVLTVARDFALMFQDETYVGWRLLNPATYFAPSTISVMDFPVTSLEHKWFNQVIDLMTFPGSDSQTYQESLVMEKEKCNKAMVILAEVKMYKANNIRSEAFIELLEGFIDVWS